MNSGLSPFWRDKRKRSIVEWPDETDPVAWKLKEEEAMVRKRLKYLHEAENARVKMLKELNRNSECEDEGEHGDDVRGTTDGELEGGQSPEGKDSQITNAGFESKIKSETRPGVGSEDDDSKEELSGLKNFESGPFKSTSSKFIQPKLEDEVVDVFGRNSNTFLPGCKTLPSPRYKFKSMNNLTGLEENSIATSSDNIEPETKLYHRLQGNDAGVSTSNLDASPVFTLVAECEKRIASEESDVKPVVSVLHKLDSKDGPQSQTVISNENLKFRGDQDFDPPGFSLGLEDLEAPSFSLGIENVTLPDTHTSFTARNRFSSFSLPHQDSNPSSQERPQIEATVKLEKNILFRENLPLINVTRTEHGRDFLDEQHLGGGKSTNSTENYKMRSNEDDNDDEFELLSIDVPGSFEGKKRKSHLDLNSRTKGNMKDIGVANVKRGKKTHSEQNIHNGSNPSPQQAMQSLPFTSTLLVNEYDATRKRKRLKKIGDMDEVNHHLKENNIYETYGRIQNEGRNPISMGDNDNFFEENMSEYSHLKNNLDADFSAEKFKTYMDDDIEEFADNDAYSHAHFYEGSTPTPAFAPNQCDGMKDNGKTDENRFKERCIREMVQNRFPHLYLLTDDPDGPDGSQRPNIHASEGWNREYIFIDYKNQFDSQTSIEVAPNTHSQTPLRNCKQIPRVGSKSMRNKQDLHGNMEHSDVNADGTGRWVSQANKNLYITKDGKELYGQRAYRQYLRESSKSGKRKKKKAQKKRNKRKGKKEL